MWLHLRRSKLGEFGLESANETLLAVLRRDRNAVLSTICRQVPCRCSERVPRRPGDQGTIVRIDRETAIAYTRVVVTVEPSTILGDLFALRLKRRI